MAFPTQVKRSPASRPLVLNAPWFAAHWQQVGLAFSAVIVASLLALFVFHNLKKLKGRAWEQLSYAQGQAAAVHQERRPVGQRQHVRELEPRPPQPHPPPARLPHHHPQGGHAQKRGDVENPQPHPPSPPG